jgi:hypothetical protein
MMAKSGSGDGVEYVAQRLKPKTGCSPGGTAEAMPFPFLASPYRVL